MPQRVCLKRMQKSELFIYRASESVKFFLSSYTKYLQASLYFFRFNSFSVWACYGLREKNGEGYGERQKKIDKHKKNPDEHIFTLVGIVPQSTFSVT